MKPPVPKWRKSSYTGSEETQACVEVADLARVIGIRDSRDPDGPRLAFARNDFRTLLHQVKAGQLDLQ